MKRGFTLMEIVIGMALSSLLAIALYSSLFQTQRTQSFVDSFSELDSSLLLITHQIERDLAGAVVFCEPKKEKNDNKTKPLKQQFVGNRQDDQLSVVTFLSTNPLSRYSVTTPRLVRIAYRLKKNKDNGFYTLLRQESDNLHWFSQREDDQPKAVVLSSSIESMSLDYIVTDTSGEKAEIKTYTEWNSDAAKKDKLQSEVAIPSYVGITLIIRDALANRSESVSCKLPIYVTTPWCHEPKPQQKRPAIPNEKGSVIPQGLNLQKQVTLPKKRTVTLVRPARERTQP